MGRAFARPVRCPLSRRPADQDRGRGGGAPNGEDKFGPVVIGGAFTVLQQARLLETAESPAAK